MRRKTKSLSTMMLAFVIVGYLVIIKVSPLQAQLADSAWPMNMHDARHTSQSSYVGPQTANLKWKYELPGSGGIPVIGSDDTIYIGNSGKFFAINKDGSLKWVFDPQGGGIGTCAAISSDGTIYVPSDSNTFYALYPNGTLKWKYYADGPMSYTSPTIGKDGTIFFGAGLDLLALNPNGTLRWKYRVGEAIHSSPAIGLDGTIYVRGKANYLCALNNDGTQKWKINLVSQISQTYASPSIGNDGTIYTFGEIDGKMGLCAINTDGSLKWVYNDLLGIYNSPAVAYDGTIYIADQVGPHFGLYGLNAIDPSGTLKWALELPGGNFFHNSPVIDVQGVIYFANDTTNYLYAINPDGTLKWTYNVASGSSIASPPVISSEGTIYFSSTDGYLYAIGQDQQLSPTPDIKANGSDISINITSDDILSITVELDAGVGLGEDADWWVVANTPFDSPHEWYYYDLNLGWIPGLFVTYQGALFDLTPFEVLNMSGLPTGTYTFYFGVDESMNGFPDMAQIYYDSVVVNIE